MGTVWILNEGLGRDYSAVEDILPEHEIRPFLVRWLDKTNVEALVSTVSRMIKRYVKADDYALISGSTIVNVVTILVWLLYHERCNLLIWNKNKKGYDVRTLYLHKVKEKIDESTEL